MDGDVRPSHILESGKEAEEVGIKYQNSTSTSSTATREYNIKFFTLYGLQQVFHLLILLKLNYHSVR